MFNHLRLNLPPIISDIDLTDFGRINLVCGKNNSGKTTLLKAIATKDYRKTGTALSADDVKIILNSVVQELLNRGARPSFPVDATLELLGQVAGTQKLWTEDEFEHLKKQFEEQRADHPIMRVHTGTA